MVNQSVLLAASTGPKRGPTAGEKQGKGESRTVHALNRLTFGPRPGDVQAAEAIGLSTWFERQLNPDKIDDSALEAKLAQFPAMQLPQQELLARYPSQQMIRQLAREEQRPMPAGPFAPRRGRFAAIMAERAAWPTDPVEKAIYADQMAFYKVQQEAKAAKDAANAAAVTAGDNGAMMQDGAPKQTAQTQSPSTDAQPMPDKQPMAADGKASEQVATALPKSEIGDPNQAANEHVEKLFKDLEAVKIINLPPEERMKKVIALSPEEFVSFRQSLSGGELLEFNQGLSPQQREIFQAMQNSTRMVGTEEMQVRLLRDIYSDRQLEAVMTDFWLNHFNVYVRKNQNEPYLIPAYERDVIRPHALGKFEDLLVATAESPAMLVYLDNWQSIGPDSQAAKNGGRYARFAQNPQVKAALKDRGLNENYGRELMELHTLGVNGGYTQKDVTEVANVFTGWTITPPAQGAQFQFDERKHEPGSKTVLGATIKENGMKEGLQVLHMLATSPATAKFVSKKLAERFVSDDPPQPLVDRMSQTFLSSGGDMKAVLRTMFESPEFWAPAAERSKVKTPEEFVVSAVRASGATVNSALPLVLALDRLGMPLYGMQTPNGYSWKNDAWVNTGSLVTRMNLALVLTGDRLPGVRTDWTQLMKGTDGGVVAKERKLEQVLLGFPLSEKTRTAVLAQADDPDAAAEAEKEFRGGGRGPGGGAAAVAAASATPDSAGAMTPGRGNGPGLWKGSGPDDKQAAVMAGLILGSPEFQRR